MASAGKVVNYTYAQMLASNKWSKAKTVEYLVKAVGETDPNYIWVVTKLVDYVDEDLIRKLLFFFQLIQIFIVHILQ